jgi:signal transduction histidine kinase
VTQCRTGVITSSESDAEWAGKRECRAVWSNMGLRLRLGLSVLIPLLLAIGLHGLVRVRQEYRSLLEAHYSVLARSAMLLAAALEVGHKADPKEVQALLRHLAEQQNHIDRIRLFDEQARPVVVSNVLDVDDARTIAEVRSVLRDAIPVRYSAGSGPSLALFHIAPVRGRDGSPVAALELVQVPRDIVPQRRAAVWDVWLRLGLVAVAVAASIGIALQRQVFDRLSRLTHAIIRLKEGDHDARAPVDGRDELGRVAESFNEMATELDIARRRLQMESERAVDLQQHLRHAERLAIVGKLASGVAHEVGTPLNIISGRAEMVLDTLDPGDARRAELTSIVKQIGRISGIIRTLLDTARQQKPMVEAVSISDTLEHVWPLMQHVARRRSVTLAASISGGLPALLADPNQLQQVLINIIINALEATPSGGTVNVSATKTDRQDSAGITVTVEDTGCGVSEADQKHIFEPFFSTKPTSEGTGLGLTISRDIIDAHGGAITLTSREGIGTTVTVWLPVPGETER